MQLSAETKAEEIVRDYTNDEEFEKMAMSIFQYQFENNPIYRQYCNSIGKTSPSHLLEIPFLPISLFKEHKISCASSHETVFYSSATTSSIPSKHYVHQLDFYYKSFLKAFEIFYGMPEDWTILALLPSYLERSGSSLINMVEELIKLSRKEESGFFLYEHDQMRKILKTNIQENKKTLLIGVSFALLDFVENFQLEKNDSLCVMETGGMKGRKKEMIREELHQLLKQGFGTSNIHSEYGMTELLSQAYSIKDGKFNSPSWMKILIREQDDPFSYAGFGKTGGINVIDFANFHSCSFISTQDLGKAHENGSFEVLGRFDSSEVRGCNLMVQ